jgi:hypothetical protein
VFSQQEQLLELEDDKNSILSNNVYRQELPNGICKKKGSQPLEKNDRRLHKYFIIVKITKC